MEKEIWKKINGKLVNPNWVIADFYEVSNKGRIRNTKTGRILTSSNGKYMLHCKELGYSYFSHCGDRGTFNIKNIMVATFENKSTFGKHIK
jgi:hypothetical protein